LFSLEEQEIGRSPSVALDPGLDLSKKFLPGAYSLLKSTLINVVLSLRPQSGGTKTEYRTRDMGIGRTILG
jgi:hypothetical protein